mgnify:CR=1 FL=1
MKKPLLIGSVVLIILLAAFFGFLKYNRSLSPGGLAAYQKNGVDLTIQYGRPAKKGRFIFGREKDKALLPYGKVWRTGANEATIIDFKNDINFAGQAVKAGKYSLWTIPEAGSWKVILNKETGQWGTEYNDGKNLLTADIAIRIRPNVQEIFTIYFEDKTTGANIILSWDQTEAIIPIQPR